MAAQQMEPITRVSEEQLLSLADAANPPCVSIYLSTNKMGRDTQGDSTKLKNLLRDAEARFEGEDRPKMLKPAWDLVDDAGFWVHSTEGLAVFAAKDFFRVHRLPVATEEIAVVADRFYVRPLLRLLRGDAFDVLVLSQNNARLLECTPHSVAEVELPDDVAKSLKEATGGPKDHHVDRAVRRQGGGTRAQTTATDLHGHGPDQDNEMQENLHFYMRQLDDGIRRAIGEQTPLLVAGAESTAPLFLHDSKHRRLMRETLHGNFEHVRDEQIRDKALEIMNREWDKQGDQLGERYGTALAQGLATNDIDEILKAAQEGRVDTLVVVPELDPSNGGAQETDQIEDAVHQTLLTKGAVVVMDRESMPGNGEVAAIYRY